MEASCTFCNWSWACSGLPWCLEHILKLWMKTVLQLILAKQDWIKNPVIPWTRCMLTQARKYQRMEMWWTGRALQLLLPIDNCLERESRFSIRVWPLKGWPCSGGWPHTQEYMGSTNCTWWNNERRTDISCVGEEGVLGLRGVRDSDENDQKTLHKILGENVLFKNNNNNKKILISTLWIDQPVSTCTSSDQVLWA